MAIRLKYDPVGAPIIASFATGVGQMNERRRREATQAMMYLDQRNLRYQMHQELMQNRENIAREYEAGRKARADAAMEARDLESYRRGIRSIVPKLPEHFVPGSEEYKRYYEELARLEDALSGRKLDYTIPEHREVIESIARGIGELIESRPAPTATARGTKGMSWLGADGKLYDPDDPDKPDGMSVWIDESGRPMPIPTDTAGDKEREKVEESARKRIEEYDAKREKIRDSLLPKDKEFAATPADYAKAWKDAGTILSNQGMLDPRLGTPSDSERLPAPPPPRIEGPTAASPSDYAGTGISMDRLGRMTDLALQRRMTETTGLRVPTGTTAAAATPSRTITPQEFNRRWKDLKPGESMVGPDGNTYIKQGA